MGRLPDLRPILAPHGSAVSEAFTLPLRNARSAPVPARLAEAPVGRQLLDAGETGGAATFCATSASSISRSAAAAAKRESFGEITLSQAIRDCYPGAIYYHLAKPYKVSECRTSGLDARIGVNPVTGSTRTKPRIQTWAHFGLGRSQILDNHYLEGELGYMAECEMQINERVEGLLILAAPTMPIASLDPLPPTFGCILRGAPQPCAPSDRGYGRTRGTGARSAAGSRTSGQR